MPPTLSWMSRAAMPFASVTIAWAIDGAILLSATFFYRLLRERGLIAIERGREVQIDATDRPEATTGAIYDVLADIYAFEYDRQRSRKVRLPTSRLIARLAYSTGQTALARAFL